jgi:hypothetical protein
MPSIAELNAENAPAVRTDADALAGVTIARDEAKIARDEARALRAEAAAKARNARDLAAKARELAAAAPKGPTVRDAVREIGREVILAAGEIAERIAAEYPEEMRDDIIATFGNQLHHLASPKTGGWPEGILPVPERSEWAGYVRS